MSKSSITYRQLWNSLLKLYEQEEAQSIVRIVLEEKYGLSLTDIVCDGIDKLTDGQKEELQKIMIRLQQGEPVQYVLGYAYFYGRKFHVAPGVLIPRPETEELCTIIINDCKSQIIYLKPQTSNLKALDIGTGSGCIAITLARELPGSEVSAIDISEDALNIAQANAKSLEADISFSQQDILKSSSLGNDKGETFSVIVSNPPYVTDSEKQAMRSNVLDYEPSTALFVPDDDPLRFYRAIADYAQVHLAEGGSLYFEINPLFANELKEMLQAKGFTDVEIVNDSFGKQRFIKGKKVKE